MSVFTIAAGVLFFTTPVEAEAGSLGPQNTPSLSNLEDDINYQTSLTTPPPPETPPPETPGPEKITGIEVLNEWGNNRFDISLDAREKADLKVVVAPEGVVEYNNMVITWESSDSEKIAVSPMMVDGRYWEATVANLARSTGTATVTITIGDPDNGGWTQDVIIRYKG